MSPAILSRPAVSDAEFPAFWAARHGKRDSDHQPRPGPIGDCLHCRMTHEEMLDFSLIRCEDAREARLPIVVMESGAHQRGLMLEGLAVQAKRRARWFNVSSVAPARMPYDNRFFCADWPPPGWPKETLVSSVGVGGDALRTSSKLVAESNLTAPPPKIEEWDVLGVRMTVDIGSGHTLPVNEPCKLCFMTPAERVAFGRLRCDAAQRLLLTTDWTPPGCTRGEGSLDAHRRTMALRGVNDAARKAARHPA